MSKPIKWLVLVNGKITQPSYTQRSKARQFAASEKAKGNTVQVKPVFTV